MLNLAPAEYNKLYKSLQFVLKWEGGYVNDPSDPGGETKYGIAKRSHPNVDIRNLTPEMACEIYYREYWVPSTCPNLDYPLCACVFDSAVNTGVSRAKGWLTESGGQVQAYLNLRKDYYVSLVYHNPSLGKFLKGWLNRVAALQKLVETTAPESPSQATA